MPDDTPIRFSLTDADGGPHDYLVALHGAVEGQGIAWRLLAAGAEPLARLIASASGGLDAAALGSLGADVRAAILSVGAPAMTRDILRYTSRDGAPLANDAAFNAAFRGNYSEMLLAVRRVTEINRFLPVSLISELAPGLRS